MKLWVVQICLNGMPWLPLHLPEFEKLSSVGIDWHYTIVHGAAANTGSTAWCQKQQPSLSRDGSSEFINSLIGHPRVTVIQRQWWPGGKDEMFQRALQGCKEPGLLFMPDVDEIFTAGQIIEIVKMFDGNQKAMRAHFKCRYFLGREIVSTSKNGYGNRVGEFLRAFRYSPEMVLQRHEPPVLNGNKGLAITREETEERGIVFNHFSWVTPETVAYKSALYGHAGGLAQWQNLQKNNAWPVRDLKAWLPWVGENASADLFTNVYPGQPNPLQNLIHQST